MHPGSKTILIALLIFVGTYFAFSSPSFPSLHVGSQNVTGAPTLTAKQVDAVLCSHSSPACGTSQSLYNASQRYQIDDRYALAVFSVESTYGRYGVAVTTHGLGNIRCSAGYSCYQGYRSYGSWQAGYNDFFGLIRNQYVNAWKLASVEQIVPKYAPASENNSAQYIASVKRLMASY